MIRSSLDRAWRGFALVAMLCLPLPAAAQQGQMPPTSVSVITMAPEALPVINELPGRVSATRIAEVRPRVSGIVVERVFEQGSIVKEGDVLYKIDPAQFEVRVRAAEAQRARAEATEMNAEIEYRRQQQLRERNVSARADLDTAETVLAQARADVAAAEATLQEAKLNLDYTQVRAPIAGTIGRALVTEGALVTSQSEVMALIQQLDPVYADFTQSSSDLRRLRQAMAAGQLVATAPNEAQVSLFFDDGTQYEHPGKLLFSEATVDTTTGQVLLRGEFPNPNGELLPGLYVRVRIEQAIRDNALAIPQMAVLRDAQGNAQVYVVRDDDTVELRTLQLGPTVGNRWIVDSGLQVGERVVAVGSQKLFPDAKVVPQQWSQAENGAN
ncbi:MexE family multidrug efflux RND transporter periplasmic adaptor subunit [Haematobacter massiliensis]|uniref:RND transporter n=1 Tax=Haematobacter massiliensis TaxID=195105 RepID=A0A086Y0V8_9RHOB|nr:efflux RND transporter periplasmic adaptor subunit [Haematobacter massiliensis]KFI27908.1 RND transporter [Haematobacter massiliensis]OWJ69975.1 MexE family multidrug efflux RND transporter periplasmic adaptor subunit [Haematobacter massiliensis]OWJ87140.1 MexE family multidrug efflux RND transporter periplasmic adaptor subunit [Haematobacter massiliensis]QBJ25210.1 efflux RND transporter periplasmic adaptor subunit [Haematobacter massiliensis]